MVIRAGSGCTFVEVSEEEVAEAEEVAEEEETADDEVAEDEVVLEEAVAWGGEGLDGPDLIDLRIFSYSSIAFLIA